MTELPKASVLVCTHNRAQTLAQSVASLLELDYPAGSWELLIVDSRSTDDTLSVARGFARERPDLVRVIEASEIGLSIARNAGIAAARFDLIAFADDDAFPERAWLRSLATALGGEGAMVAGGPVEPIFEGPLPGWLTDRFLPYLAVWDKGEHVQALSYSNYPRGNNIAFRREVFARFGLFSPHLGRRGRALLSCEETELCLRVERGGGRILYVPGARIRHLTATDRITPQWMARRFFAQGRSESILDWRHAGWRGLRRAWPRFAGYVRQAAHGRHLPPDGAVYFHCQRRALAGYSLGALTAPATVPRYRAPADHDSDWLP